MTILRFSAAVVFATSLVMSGCKKTDKAPAADPAATAGAKSAETPAAPAAAAPAAPAAAAPAAGGGGGGGGVIPQATLEAISLPAPKGAPAKGMWSTPTANSDGDRSTNFMDGNDLWVSVRFLDCNLQMVKDSASKPANERGDFSFCFDQPTAKLKDYPMFPVSDSVRVVKVGHVAVIVGLGVVAEGKIPPADIEAFISSLDLSSLTK